MTGEYPHVPAAFINAIRDEEGTKEEACDWLQKQWNETCALRRELDGRLSTPVANYEKMTPEEVLAEMKTRRYSRTGQTEVILMKGAALIEELQEELRNIKFGRGYPS